MTSEVIVGREAGRRCGHRRLARGVAAALSLSVFGLRRITELSVVHILGSRRRHSSSGVTVPARSSRFSDLQQHPHGTSSMSKVG